MQPSMALPKVTSSHNPRSRSTLVDGAKGRVLVSRQFDWKCIADLMLSTYNAVLADEIPHEAASSIGFR